MVAYGWSVGDFVTTIKILLAIIKAFDKAKGAKKHYAVSSGFLLQLIPILRRLNQQVNDTDDIDYQGDLPHHRDAIAAAFDDFNNYLNKKYNGLSAKDTSKTQQLLLTINWAIDEMHEKVQKMRLKITDAMVPYQTIMMQEIHQKVIDISEDYRSAAATAEERERRLVDVQETFAEIQKQNEVLVKASKDYQVTVAEEQRMVAEEQRRQQSSDTAHICSRLDVIQVNQQRQATKDQLDEMEFKQSELLQSQIELIRLVDQQRRQAQSRAEQEQWKELQVEAKEQRQEAEKAQADLRKDLQDGVQVLEGLKEVTNDSRFRVLSEKLSGCGKMLGVLGPLFGGSSRDDEPPQRSSRASSAPQGTQLRAAGSQLQRARTLGPGRSPYQTRARQPLEQAWNDSLTTPASAACCPSCSMYSWLRSDVDDSDDKDARPRLPARPNLISTLTELSTRKQPPALPPRGALGSAIAAGQLAFARTYSSPSVGTPAAASPTWQDISSPSITIDHHDPWHSSALRSVSTSTADSISITHNATRTPSLASSATTTSIRSSPVLMPSVMMRCHYPSSPAGPDVRGWLATSANPAEPIEMNLLQVGSLGKSSVNERRSRFEGAPVMCMAFTSVTT